MSDLGGGFGLPQMNKRDMFEQLLSEDTNRSSIEPEIASAIGEQMLHMDLRQLPRSVRVRIRDITGRIPTKNTIIVGGGIGHLTAWLLDLWCGDPANDSEDIRHKPNTLRVIEEGGKFGIIIDRLIRRYSANNWAEVIVGSWSEVFAETQSWNAAAAALPDSARMSPLPQPIDLIIVDLSDDERVEASISAFDLLSVGGILITLEPEVPTGDVGDPKDGQERTPAQRKVESFNRWISFIQNVDAHHSAAFLELTGGTLAVFRRSA
tara:strand:- start:7447 stop:8241 length:795 start_codon:yes stop_codon:yes gene_type:complete